MLIFRHLFLSNNWWQKSDIWSQASYRGIWRIQKRFPQYGIPIWRFVTKYQISAINNCWEKCDEKCAYMFNVYKNQLSRQCCVLSEEATNTNFIVFSLTRSGLEPTIYHTRGEHANHYTIDAVSIDLLHILDLILNSYVFIPFQYELFPLRRDKCYPAKQQQWIWQRL
jgi:hypothetical protein